MRAKVETVIKQNHIDLSEYTHSKNMKIKWETEFDESIGMLRLKGQITPSQVDQASES